MVKKTTLLFVLLFTLCFMAPPMVQAKIQTAVSTVRQPFDGSQPPESARFVAAVKAKQETLQKAGKYFQKLDTVKNKALGNDQVMALAAGILETNIVSQKNYTTDDAFGFEVSVGVEVDTTRLEPQVENLLNNKGLLKKYYNIVTREAQLLSRIDALESEYRKAKKASTEEQESLQQNIQNTISALSAVALYKKAVYLVKDQASASQVPQEAIGYLHTATNLDPEYKDAFIWLGNIFSDKGAFDRAVEYYQKALVIDFKTLGENNPDMAVAYNRLGLAFHRNGEYDRALESFQKAWKIQINTLGESHPDVATTYNNMGETYRKKGDYDRAIEYYQKDLEISLKALGRKHLNVATSYNNLAYAYYDKGEYDRAIEYFQDALEVYGITLGKNHPQTKTVEKTIEFLKTQPR